MTSKEKLIIIHQWTHEFNINPNMGGTHYGKIKFDSKYVYTTLDYDTVQEIIDFTFFLITAKIWGMVK